MTPRANPQEEKYIRNREEKKMKRPGLFNSL
jgi:hypothetical protein